MNKTKELVAAGHALAKELHCPESAALVRELATQLDVQHARADVLATDNEKAMESLKQADAAIKLAYEKFSSLAAENTYLLNGAARELTTSWMFHKTMLGAQAALVCVAQGDIKSARDWLEGTTDEAGADMPDDITVADLQSWFDSQMVSNDGKGGFLTRQQAEEAIKAQCPKTDLILAEVQAQAIRTALDECPEHCDTDCVMDSLGISYEGAELRAEGALALYGALREFAQQLREAK